MIYEEKMLNGLCHELQVLKAKKQSVQVAIDELEQRITQLLPSVKEEGIDKLETDEFKVSITSKLNRSLNQKEVINFIKFIPPKLRPLKQEYKIDLKKLREFEKFYPTEFSNFAGCLTTKPAKKSLKIERREDK